MDEKKTCMTCLEWLKKNMPGCVSKKFRGGGRGCPEYYEGLEDVKGLCEDPSECSKRDICEKCWSQPVPEGVE